MSDLLHGVVCHDVVDIFLYELVIGQLGVGWGGVVLMGGSGWCVGEFQVLVWLGAIEQGWRCCLSPTCVDV